APAPRPPEPAPGQPSTPPSPADGGRSPGRRRLAAFGQFWWEFLIGDTPELFVGMLVVLGIAAGLATLGGVVAVVVVPLAVIALLVLSVLRGRKPAAG
ncbi:MAG: hypothetical protein ACRD0J_15695, partial [Acidimicrobiales bacterium]